MGRRAVHRGSHKWMAKADTGSDFDQLGVFRGSKRAAIDAELRGSAPDERGVTDRLCRREQQQSPSRFREFAGPLEIEILQVAWEVRAVEKLEATGQLRGAHASRQVKQRERVSTRLGDYAIADSVVEPTRDGAHQQSARIVLSEPAHDQLGKAVEVMPAVRLVDGDQERHRF